jgi:hypothetical protein
VNSALTSAEQRILRFSMQRSATQHERIFFSGMAVALALTTVVGFAPSYYFKAYFGASPPLSSLLRLHGAVMSGWMMLLVAQTFLVAAGRTDIHRRLGTVGVVLAVVIVVLGPTVAITRVRQGLFCVPCGPPLAALAVPLATAVVFPVLFVAAMWLRKRVDAHKRLLLIATIEFVTAAVGRIPAVHLPGLPSGTMYAATDLFLVAIAVYDLAALKRLHPATLAGGSVLVGSQLAREAIKDSPTWLAFAAWLTT